MAKNTRGNPRPTTVESVDNPPVKRSPKKYKGRLSPQQKGKLKAMFHRDLAAR